MTWPELGRRLSEKGDTVAPFHNSIKKLLLLKGSQEGNLIPSSINRPHPSRLLGPTTIL